MHASDDELIDAFLDGDNKAFSRIVERHRTRLTYVARKYANNDTDAHDIVQEALLKASQALPSYRKDSQLYTWLHKLVLNAGYDFLNHRANRATYSLDTELMDLERNARHSHSFDADLKMMLDAALEQLRPEYREAFYLTEIAGYSINDAAQMQGVQSGTIKSRRARAKEVLRTTLEIG